MAKNEPSDGDISNFLDAILTERVGNEVRMIRGKVTDVAGSVLVVTIGGGTTEVPIKYAASLSPVDGDEVFILTAGPDKIAVFKLA
jgi:hypothetical protein